MLGANKFAALSESCPVEADVTEEEKFTNTDVNPSNKKKKSKNKKKKRNASKADRAEIETKPQEFDDYEKLIKSLSNADLCASKENLHIRGYFNESNSCYMNAILQLLFHADPFYSFACKFIQSTKGINIFEKEFFKDAKVFRSLMKTFDQYSVGGTYAQSAGSYNLPPLKVDQNLFSVLRLERGVQEDSSECLNLLLSALHEELANSFSKNKTNEKAIEPLDNSDNSGWLVVGKDKKQMAVARTCDHDGTGDAGTPFQEIFSGATLVQTMYDNPITSKKEQLTAVKEPFFILPVSISHNAARTLKSCLSGAFESENVSDYRHHSISSPVEVIRKPTIDKLPQVLIIQLKRFHYGQSETTQDWTILKSTKLIKIDETIDIPGKILSAGNRFSNGDRSYSLQAIVFHIGYTATQGHYTCALRCENPRRYLYLDDSEKCVVRNQDISSLLQTHAPLNAHTSKFDHDLSFVESQSAHPPMHAPGGLRPNIMQQPRTPYLLMYTRNNSQNSRSTASQNQSSHRLVNGRR